MAEMGSRFLSVGLMEVNTSPADSCLNIGNNISMNG